MSASTSLVQANVFILVPVARKLGDVQLWILARVIGDRRYEAARQWISKNL